jgi:chemotaxis protein MotB
MFTTGRRSRNAINIWPGFVDILATLLLMFVFVLTIFMISQHYLSAALTGRTSALQQLELDIQALADVLALERSQAAGLEAELEKARLELMATLGERDALRRQQELTLATAEALDAELEQARERLAAAGEREAELVADQAGQAELLSQARERAGLAEDDVARLNRQLVALREQLHQLQAALELAEGTVSEQRLQIEDLGHKLNVALASKVQELQRYRSEFFGRLRALLGERSDIRIVGDRFVFQSELFFESASAQIGAAGQRQLAQVADTLAQLARQIPADIDWVLQVEGHTDVRPISTDEFPSNWELSSARANSIVHFLIRHGIPPQRLAAAGFAEFQPVDPARTEDAYRRNRRIELKFTSR